MSCDTLNTFMKPKFALIILLFLSFCRAGFSEEQQLVDRVAAVVNKEIITQSEVDMLFRPIYEQIKNTYKGHNLQSELESLRLKLLNQLIEDRLVAQEAQKLGIVVGNEELAEEMAQFKKQFPDEAAFEKEISASGISREDIEKRFKERLAITKLHQAIIRGHVVVSPSEAEQYFKAHPEQFFQKEQIELWCITLRKGEEAIQKGTMDEGVKRKANQLLSDLKKGKDFEELAQKHSEDSNAADKGYMGFMDHGNLVPDIDKVLFSLPENNISEVLETETAYHIFKVGKKRPASSKTFDEVKDQVNDMLFRKKAHQRFINWMDDLKKKSFISVR